MSASFDPILIKELEALAIMVRQASQEGKILLLPDVWPGTEEEFRTLLQARIVSGLDDIILFRDKESVYLYSEQHMTRSYAEAAGRVRSQDAPHIIAETVRSDSRTYPRPTPVNTFSEPPFLLMPEALASAVNTISDDPRYADIQLLCTSDGSLFLYSSIHMHPAHAASLAEWISVDQLENP